MINETTYISVDVEAAGPNPGNYSLLSIGACTLTEPRETFYIEIQPVNDQITQEASLISQLDLVDLQKHAAPPDQAMSRFADWVSQVTAAGTTPVFLAFNAAFDWMFVNDYFHRYLGYNPFGHKALDIKAFYMGLRGVAWSQTSMEFLADRYLAGQELSHNALSDAVDQARIFQQLLLDAGMSFEPERGDDDE
jgi:ribonuclease T